VLACLRHDAVVGSDDKQSEIDASGAGDHSVHEFLMARDIDEADRHAVCDRQIGKAQVDGYAARLFFFEPIGVNAGERAHKRRFPVVDVTRGADDHRDGSGKGERDWRAWLRRSH
jgi:hypothetical protein